LSLARSANITRKRRINQYLIDRGKEDKLKLAQTLPENVNIHYIAQDTNDKYGTAIPVAMAVKEFKINEPTLVFMGDDFIWNPTGDSATESLLQTLKSEDESAILGVEIPREDVEKYGVISETDGKMTGIVEKPSIDEAPSNLINVSKYVMSAELLQEVVKYVDTHDFDARDQEYLITDPIDSYIQNGGTMRVARTAGEYLDGGSVEGWVHANNVVCGR